MFTNVRRTQRAVCVLLGGPGLRVAQPQSARRIPLLCKPWSGKAALAPGQDQAAPALAEA